MKSCYETWEDMTDVAKSQPVMNYSQVINMDHYLVETELFPLETLEAYSTWNLGLPIADHQKKHFSGERGGGQGDYRDLMQDKIKNVIDCLTKFPSSKRAVITIPNNPVPNHKSDDDAKCMREIHFHLDQNQLHATVLFRAQAAEIFPKNIHFIGSLMSLISRDLPGRPRLGQLHYLATTLVATRWS